jgi:hypothetical protein
LLLSVAVRIHLSRCTRIAELHRPSLLHWTSKADQSNRILIMRMTIDRLSDREYSERLAHLTGSALEDEEFWPAFAG